MSTNDERLIPHSDFDHVFVVLRLDEYLGETASIEEKIGATKAFWTIESAEAEAKRLNELKAGTGVLYFCKTARVEKAAKAAPVLVEKRSLHGATGQIFITVPEEANELPQGKEAIPFSQVSIYHDMGSPMTETFTQLAPTGT